MALAEMGFGLNGIGLNGYWPNWELDQVALDEMALDEMGLDEVAIPRIFRPPVQAGSRALISKFLSFMILYNHSSYNKMGK